MLRHSNPLFIIHYSLFTIHYSLFTIHYSLFTIHYSLFTIHFSYHFRQVIFPFYPAGVDGIVFGAGIQNFDTNSPKFS